MSNGEDLDKLIENVKNSVREAFVRIAANLKARELETLRQLNAIRMQSKVNEELKRKCLHNLHISYEYESKLLDSINRYGTIDFQQLNLDSSLLNTDLDNTKNVFSDNLYSVNCIGDHTSEESTANICTEAAVPGKDNRINNCTCNVDTMNGIITSNTSRKCSDSYSFPSEHCTDNGDSNMQSIKDKEHSQQRQNSVKKKEPTDDWLESIKNEIDAEPLAKDMMEHINITEP